MKIIFMGTPDFAVPSLKILLENGLNVVAVVTAADKTGGRLGVIESAVKKFAVAHNIPVLQPEKLKNVDFLAKLASFEADLQIVVAFRMLPEVVWAMPKMGTFNLHGSLLPKYRGAAPINWAVIRGEKETGCSTFFLQHEIDTGDLLFQEKMPIGADETAGEIHDKMMDLGAKLVLKTVKSIEKGTQSGIPQNANLATHAPKIFTETCQIDFQKTASDVHNFVRGLSPFPGAWTIFEGKTLKILRTKFDSEVSEKSAGEFFTDGRNFLKFACQNGAVEILELQLEGKKRMAVRDFLNGHKFEK
jgi:methionyl-tRNA formyltransferase